MLATQRLSLPRWPRTPRRCWSIAIRDRLLAAGATALVMPCNTAHPCDPALAADCPVLFPSIIAATCDVVTARSGPGARIALVATRATLAWRLFDRPLADYGRIACPPADSLLDAEILPAMADVRAGRMAAAGRRMRQAVDRLLQEADCLVLACTEAPLALAAAPSGAAGVRALVAAGAGVSSSTLQVDAQVTDLIESGIETRPYNSASC